MTSVWVVGEDSLIAEALAGQFEIRGCTDARHALIRALEAPPEAILLVLPRLGSLNELMFARALRGGLREDCPRLILVATGRVRRPVQSEFDAVFQVPIRCADLVSALQRLIGPSAERRLA